MPGLQDLDLDSFATAITKTLEDFEDLKEDFHGKIKELDKFYSDKTDDKSKILYQYDPDNQEKFYNATNVINDALSAVDLVLFRMFRDLTEMEAVLSSNERPEPITEKSQQSHLPQKKGTGILGGIKQIMKKKQRQIPGVFELELKEIDRIKSVQEKWYEHIDYHAFAVELSEEFSKSTMEIHLSPEKAEYKMRIARVQTIVDHYLKIKLESVEAKSLDVLTASVKLDHITRNDMARMTPP